MTYNVFGGTLNLALSQSHCCDAEMLTLRARLFVAHSVSIILSPSALLAQSCPWDGSTHGLGWVALGWIELGRDF